MILKMTWPMYLRRELEVDGKTFQLTRQQTEMVFNLLLRRGETVTQEHMISLVWPNVASEPGDAAGVLKSQVYLLAKRVGAKFILPVNGGGGRNDAKGWLIERPDDEEIRRTKFIQSISLDFAAKDRFRTGQDIRLEKPAFAASSVWRLYPPGFPKGLLSRKAA